MSTPAPNGLTPEQQELLSAYLDGETSAAETAAVELLLKQPEAREYLDTLAATRELVLKHAPVRAPVGLSGRVMKELDLKPAAGAGNLTAMPRMSWAAPLWAAAAVVVVSLGIMFGPAMFNTSTAPEQDIARQALDNLAAPELSDSMKPSGGGPGSDPFTRQRDEVMRDKEATNEWGEPLGGNSRVESEPPVPETTAGDPAMRPRSNSQPGRMEPRDAEDGRESLGRGGAQGGAKDGEVRRELEDTSKAGKADDDNLNERRGGIRAARTAAPAAGAAEAKETEEGTADNAEKPTEKATEEPRKQEDNDGGRRTRNSEEPQGEGAPTPPSADPAPAGAPAAKFAEADEVSLTVTEGASVAAQVDFLWVSNLYGTASLDEASEADVEDIIITLDPRRLADLLAALRKVADDQGYGRVDGAKGVNRPAEVDNADTHVADGRPVSGYLPSRLFADAPDAGTGRPAPIKVRITLK